jgi:hypothetical protein
MIIDAYYCDGQYQGAGVKKEIRGLPVQVTIWKHFPVMLFKVMCRRLCG